MSANILLNENKSYIQVTKKDVPDNFNIINNYVYLKGSSSSPFTIKFPLRLDENVAKIAAMILDGSISKNLSSCMFCQKKDKKKPIEFNNIIRNLFGLKGHFHIQNPSKTTIVNFSRKSFVSFLYYCLNIHKSDESARIPSWVWNSPRSVIVEYLRYAFAMEGSIKHYLKASEIRFHSVDLEYINDLKKILEDKFGITSKIQKYYINKYGWKYYLYFCDKINIIKFTEIGFALDTHQKRLNQLVCSFHNRAWEITLVKLLELGENFFTLTDVNKMFQYLCKRSIHYRLNNLVDLGYLKKERIGYSITKSGYQIALLLENKVNVTKLRTNPVENEAKIIKFLNRNYKSYRNEIAEKLKLNVSTVRDALWRLTKEDRIRYLGCDKFQRKFYRIK